MNNDRDKNALDGFSSKVKRLYIPLPNYKFFHKPTSVDEEDGHFVGRKRLIETLKLWIGNSSKNNRVNPSGSYLITGFRGVGKSSVVGKAISEVIENNSLWKHYNRLFNKLGFETPTGFQRFWKNYVRPLLDSVALLCVLLVVPVFATLNPSEKSIAALYSVIPEWGRWLFVGAVVYLILRMFVRHWRPYVHHVNISIGDQIDSERDVLALVADSIRTKFSGYMKKKYPARASSLLRKMLSAIVITLTFLLIRVVFNGEEILKDLHILSIIENVNIPGDIPRDMPEDIPGDNTTPPSSVEKNKVSVKDLVKATGAFVLAILTLMFIRKAGKGVLSFLGVRFRFVSGREVLAKLNDCCDRINAEVGETRESGGSFNAKAGSFVDGSFFRRMGRSKRYPFASVREIEQELMEIIKMFHESWLVRARLIIVLDELDKLVIRDNKGNDEEPDLPEFTHGNSGFPGGDTYRAKKQNILYLLAQLKFFLSNTRAKFIFIAGRELFDAYKEDVADREYSISSIFNGILNVDSFFTYKSGTKDITRMTERYLCKQLLIEGPDLERDQEKPESHDKLSLHQYYNEYRAFNDSEADMVKAVVFLRHLVTYLTFVSNGAPKKITNQFERFIISKDQFEAKMKEGGDHTAVFLCEDKEKTYDYYLSFGYYDQQKINFVHYMVNPVFRSILSPSSEYGDKLLVSASFMLGHIFKHYNGGFSMQNLEYIPELIETTKTPELREIVNSIVSFLGQIHIAKIPTGLHEFKFHMKLYEEISMFSKKSELISSIFNFSRDYSLSVKRYFSDVLKYYSSQAECDHIVLSSIHRYLGDLHMASEEFSDAISHYWITKNLILKAMRTDAESQRDKNATMVARLTRAMLKLGLAYEKRNAIDLAYLTYSELVDMLIDNRFIDEKAFGLDYRLEKTPSWESNRIRIFPAKGPVQWGGTPPSNRERFSEIRPPFITDAEKENAYWTNDNDLTRQLSYHLSKESSSLITKLSIYEDLRVAYTPLLAKLFSIEKQNIGGITLTNLAVMEAEFRHLFLLTNGREKYILSADFFRKLGDMLFYKNSDFKREKNNLVSLLDIWDFNLVKDITDYCFSRDDISNKTTHDIVEKVKRITVVAEDITKRDSQFKDLRENSKHGTAMLRWYYEKLETGMSPKEREIISGFTKSKFNRLPAHYASLRVNGMLDCIELPGRACYACKYYNRSLQILTENILPKSEFRKYMRMSKGVVFLAKAKLGDAHKWREKELSQIALSLESMGHVILSCHKETDKFKNDLLELLIELYDSDNPSYARDETQWLDKMKQTEINAMEKALIYYLAAAEFFKLSGDTMQAAQCVVKILHIFYSFMPYDTTANPKWVIPEQFRDFVELLKNKFITDGVRNVQSSYDYYSLLGKPEFQRASETKEEAKKKTKKKIKKEIPVPLDASSNAADFEELILNYYHIRISMEYTNKQYAIETETLKRLYGSMSLTCNRLDGLSYNRVTSLYFKARLNRMMLRRFATGNRQKDVWHDDFEKAFGRMFRKLRLHDYQPTQEVLVVCDVFGVEPDKACEIVEFLITDSIFCLSNIVEYLTPTFRSTMFSNKFYGRIYEHLLEWVKIKECYEARLGSEKEKKKFVDYFNQKVHESSRQFLRKTYLGEMAVKYFTKSLQMASEGETYRDYIAGLTIADDDLQNDVLQFFLAIERYRIGIGVVEKNIKRVEEFTKEKSFTKDKNGVRIDLPRKKITDSAVYTAGRYWRFVEK